MRSEITSVKAVAPSPPLSAILSFSLLTSPGALWPREPDEFLQCSRHSPVSAVAHQLISPCLLEPPALHSVTATLSVCALPNPRYTWGEKFPRRNEGEKVAVAKSTRNQNKQATKKGGGRRRTQLFCCMFGPLIRCSNKICCPILVQNTIFRPPLIAISMLSLGRDRALKITHKKKTVG